jgi:hypothetical protein
MDWPARWKRLRWKENYGPKFDFYFAPSII